MDSNTLGVLALILVGLATLPATAAIAWLALKLVVDSIASGGNRVTT